VRSTPIATDRAADGEPTLSAHLQRLSQSEGQTIARSFYHELFHRDPRIRAYFAGLDVDGQAAKLWNVLRLVVAHERQSQRFSEIGDRVARSHATRHVSRADVDLFIDTLADVLAHTQWLLPPAEAKRRWLPELRELATLIKARSP